MPSSCLSMITVCKSPSELQGERRSELGRRRESIRLNIEICHLVALHERSGCSIQNEPRLGSDQGTHPLRLSRDLIGQSILPSTLGHHLSTNAGTTCPRCTFCPTSDGICYCTEEALLVADQRTGHFNDPHTSMTEHCSGDLPLRKTWPGVVAKT
jgi:hypothetical protein